MLLSAPTLQHDCTSMGQHVWLAALEASWTTEKECKGQSQSPERTNTYKKHPR